MSFSPRLSGGGALQVFGLPRKRKKRFQRFDDASWPFRPQHPHLVTRRDQRQALQIHSTESNSIHVCTNGGSEYLTATLLPILSPSR